MRTQGPVRMTACPGEGKKLSGAPNVNAHTTGVNQKLPYIARRGEDALLLYAAGGRWRTRAGLGPNDRGLRSGRRARSSA